MDVKTCTKCKTEKPLGMFCLARGGHYGVASRCRACMNAYGIAYRVANPDKAKADEASYRKRNHARIKAINAAYWVSNKEKIKARKAVYQAANPEKARVACAAWGKLNREKTRIYCRNRRARKFKAGGTLSQGLASRLFTLQRGKCPCCGLPLGDNYHLDHIMPLALGGSNTDDNIQLLRAICNRQKHTAHPSEFMRQRGFLL